jgi:hypothetical protein
MMDNVHKHNICTNVPSSQTFGSYLVKLQTTHCILNIVKTLANKIPYLHIARHVHPHTTAQTHVFKLYSQTCQ